MNSLGEWVRSHASAVLIGAELIGALFLVVIGLLLTDYAGQHDAEGLSTALKTAGVVAINLSGVLLAAATATLFFALPDVRAGLGNALRELLAEGSVVTLVSPKIRNTLRKRLVAHDLGVQHTDLDRSLYEHLRGLSNGCLASVSVSSMNVRYSVGRPDQDAWRQVTLVRRYRVHAPVSARDFTFPVRIWRELLVPPGVAASLEDWFVEMKIEIGATRLEQNDLTLECEQLSEGWRRFTGVLRRDVWVPESEVDVVEQVVTRSFYDDPTVNVFARFPTRGLSVVVSRDESYDYQSYWYLFCAPDLDTPKLGSKDFLPGAVSVSTNEWILPGEGVAITMSKVDSVVISPGEGQGVAGEGRHGTKPRSRNGL